MRMNTNMTMAKWEVIWKTMRDVVAGRDAVIEHDIVVCGGGFGSRDAIARPHLYAYVNPLGGQLATDYTSYLMRGNFFGATDRTINAFAGLIFAKEPEIETSGDFEDYLGDVDLQGTSARDFAQKLVYEELTVGRVGILVDYTTDNDGGRSYLSMFAAESIKCYRERFVKGAGKVLVFLELMEKYQDNDGKDCEQKRELSIDSDGYYLQRVLRIDNKTGVYIEVERFEPKINGKRMSRIPFYFVGGCEIRKPLLLDLAHTNLAHWRNDIELAHGLHFAAIPTFCITGHTQNDSDGKITIGGESAIVLSNPNAKAGFAEFSGAGLGSLRDRGDDLMAQMAALGSNVLSSERQANETLGGAELRTAGERGALTAIARDVSIALSRALTAMVSWALGGMDVTAEIELNTDFGAHRMDSQMLTALINGVNSGIIPMQVFVDNMRRGGIVGEGLSNDDYMAVIENEPPSTKPSNATLDNND